MSRFLDYNHDDPSPAQEFRLRCRTEEFRSPTAGYCMDFVQTNVTFLPQEYSTDFLLFCQRNPKPCPLLEMTTTKTAEIIAPGSNLYTDIPLYNILENGKIVKSCTNIEEYQDRGLNAFMLGCSFSFEHALIKEGVPVRHIEEHKNVPMYITNIDCRPAGVFRGPLIVSMRPIPADLVNKAAEISARFPGVHGAPIHRGDPSLIGIKDLQKVDYGDAVTINPGEVPMFWACGVTPMQAIITAKIPFAITHSPGHMFITDRANSFLDVSNLTYKYELR